MTWETPCDVDAAGGDVGGDEDPELVLAELGQRLLARHLRHVAVQRRGAEAALGQVVGDPLRLPLGAGEDDDLVGVLGLQDAADDLGLVEVVGLVDELRGRRHQLGVVRRLGADVHRVAHVGAGQGDDRGRHGGREQHRLPGLGRHRRAAARRRAGSRGRASRRPRRGPARARGRCRGTGGCTGRSGGPGVPTTMSTPVVERVELGLVGDAAVDGEDAQAAVLAGQREVAGDLERELAGRGDDQRLRLALRQVGVGRVRRGRRCAAAPGCRRPASCRCPCGPGRSGRCRAGRPRGSSPGWRRGW